MGVDLPQLRLENNGMTINISTYLPTGYLKEIGARGFGVAPTRVNIKEGAGPGGRWKNTKRLTREIDLPIIFQAENRAAIRVMMQDLIKLLDDTFTVATLYVVFPDGTELSTSVHYGGGGDAQHGVDTNMRTYARWPLTLRAPDPYWTATDSITYSLRAENSGRGLIKTASLIELSISSAQTIGTIVVDNPGDVEAKPVWTITGPGDSFTATRLIDSASFAYNAAITTMNPITFDTRAKTVKDASGVNKYTNLGTAPKLFALPRGSSSIYVALVNSNANSIVSLYFQPRYELVF